MRICVTTITGREYDLSNITELCLTSTARVACDSLAVNFMCCDGAEEIVTVKAFDGETCLFNGLCDMQKNKITDEGFNVYIYARSTAALLVDNEAEPFTYNRPTAKQLWFTFAKPFGFKWDLPDIQCGDKYEVTMGTSCYGAISHFVSTAADRQIYITADNHIRLLEESTDIKSLNAYNVLSVQYVINRSEPLTEICFKKDISSSGYKMHTKAKAADCLMLSRRKHYVNLMSLAPWQRAYTIAQKLKASYENYETLEAVVSGYVREELYQRFSFSLRLGNDNDYLLSEKRYVVDKNGERTRLILKKKFDIKEITYVD